MTREYVHGLGFLLAVWIIAIVCGVFIGRAKGQFASGILWPLLFGPIGLKSSRSRNSSVRTLNQLPLTGGSSASAVEIKTLAICL